MCKEGHAFRGEYLHHCSQVEAWAVAVFSNNLVVESGLLRKRMPHLFGQKLKAIADLAGAPSPVFSRPKRVSELLEKFQPYAALRADLAHATMVSAGSNGQSIFAFDNPNGPRLPLGRERMWLTPSEALGLLSELKQLTKEICDQKVRAKANPSSPRPPGPAAAGGP